jgi:hypothetical protein
MSRFRRRLIALERALLSEERVTTVALETGGPDMICIGGKWKPCADVSPYLALRNPAVKVFIGYLPGAGWPRATDSNVPTGGE